MTMVFADWIGCAKCPQQHPQGYLQSSGRSSADIVWGVQMEAVLSHSRVPCEEGPQVVAKPP